MCAHSCCKNKYQPTKYTIKDMQELAKQKGGNCLSKEYINCKTKLEWQCSKGHRWWTTPTNIKQGHWCPLCAKNSLKLTMEDMKKLAKKRNGKCLSNIYINSHTNLKWECHLGHQWEANPHSIKSGSWCPHCSKITHISEEKCRYIFEQLTGYRFPKSRKILGNRQEIDGYCKELNIGFEHQGEHHYKKLKRFSEEKFKYTRRMDRKKNL